MFVQNFKILEHVIAEKSLTKQREFTIRQISVRKRQKKLYTPLYFVNRGYEVSMMTKSIHDKIKNLKAQTGGFFVALFWY